MHEKPLLSEKRRSGGQPGNKNAARRRPCVPVDDKHARVILTRGMFALIDSADVRLVEAHSWCAHRSSSGFYATCRINRELIFMHHFVLGVPSDICVDHKNGDRLDNRRDNLRLATAQQNMCNQRPRGGSSRFKGVHWNRHAGKWQASLTIDYRYVYLGLFTNEVEAASAYDRAARELFGEFARLNFSEEGTAA